MEKELSRDAKIILLIMAANGGNMTRKDAEREWRRVNAMSETEYDLWFARVHALIQNKMAFEDIEDPPGPI